MNPALEYIVSILGLIIKLFFKILCFPFKVLWYYLNPLNVKRVRIEK